MPNMTHAHLGFLGIGPQTGSDLRASKIAAAYWARYHSLVFEEKRGIVFDPTSGSSVAQGMSQGNYDIQVKSMLEASTEGPLVPLLHSVLGGAVTTATTGTTGKKHTIPMAEVVPTSGRMTFEQRLGTMAKSKRCNGIVKHFGFDATAPDYAKVACDAVASKAEILTTPSTPTLASPLSVLSQKATTFTFDSLTTWGVRNFKWDIARILDEDDFDVVDQQRRDAEYGDLIVTVEAECVLPDLEIYERFLGGNGLTAPSDTEAYFACSIETQRNDLIPGGTARHGIKINLPALGLTAGPPTEARGREKILTTLQGQATYSVASSKAVDVEVVNSVSSYALP
jgi:hypothetical protein